jgi:hypothetical protein
MSKQQALDFQATSSLIGSLTTKPISYAKDVHGNREALDKAKIRTSMANATWVPKKEQQQAETDVRMLTKTAWHIGGGYNIGVGFAGQHGFNTLGMHSGQEPPRIYEYAGLTVTGFTKSSGPFMSDQRKDARISTMLESKKDRHDYAIKDMEAKLKLIHDSLEPVVVELIRTVRTNLKENEDIIEELFLRLADEFLTRIDMAQLQGVWSEYQEQSKLREVWISEFEEQTEALELQRSALVKNELKILGAILLDVAHELRGPIERMLEEYAHKQNILALNNRRAYADMVQRLRRHEIERDKKARVRWEHRKEAWYETLHDRAVAKCKATLESKPYSHPKKRDTLYGALRSQQVILFERRIAMWMDLQTLTPPSLTSEKAKEWTNNLVQLDAEQELEHKQRCGSIRKFEMEHYDDSRKVIEALKKELKGYAEMTDAIMPTEEELAECSEQFEVLIKTRRDMGLEAVRQCSETLGLQLEYLKSPGLALGTLVQRIAEVIEKQAAEVKEQRRAHAVKMEEQREENKQLDIKLEDDYEYLTTLMRQESSVENLRAKLPEALEALDKIKAEYRRFYDQSMDETRQFDSGMRALLYGLDHLICTRLDLAREPPKAPTPGPAEGEEKPDADADAEGGEGEEGEKEEEAPVVYDDEEQTVGEEYDYVTLSNERRLFTQDNRHPKHAHDLVGILAIPHKTEAEKQEDALLAAEAAEEAAAIAAAAGEEEAPAGEPEEEGEEGGEQKAKFVADAMVSPENPFSAWGNEPLLEVLEIPVTSLLAIRRTQRRALLEYKAEQDVDVLQDTEAVVKEEQETLTVQLDERLRLWSPRPGRAEMDVYEVRDTQLHQHQSKKDRHVGALSMRAALQQAQYTGMLAEAERLLKEHGKAQQVRIKALEMATNSSQLSNYERLAKLNDFEFKEGAKARQLAVEDFANEALAGLKKMNRQFLEHCYLFEELGGPAGKGGTYNPEEITEYRKHLDLLDADAAERTSEWIKYGEEVLERHKKRAEEALEQFYAAKHNVETDIGMLEAVDKEVRVCSLLQNQQLSAHDALVEVLDQKIIELEGLCAGATQSTLGSSVLRADVQLADEEEEEEFQHDPLALKILQTLYSIRWRILDRVKFMQCLQSSLELGDPLDLFPPLPPLQDSCPEDMQEDETIAPLRALLWPPAPEEGEEGEAAQAEVAAEATEEDKAAAARARFSKADMTDERPAAKDGTPEHFQAAVEEIQRKQKTALEELVAKYFAELGDREITRKEGDPACSADRFIPTDAEGFNEKNAKRLQELHANALETQKNKVRYLRSVVARISTVLGKVAGAQETLLIAQETLPLWCFWTLW